MQSISIIIIISIHRWQWKIMLLTLFLTHITIYKLNSLSIVAHNFDIKSKTLSRLKKLWKGKRETTKKIYKQYTIIFIYIRKYFWGTSYPIIFSGVGERVFSMLIVNWPSQIPCTSPLILFLQIIQYFLWEIALQKGRYITFNHQCHNPFHS